MNPSIHNITSLMEGELIKDEELWFTFLPQTSTSLGEKGATLVLEYAIAEDLFYSLRLGFLPFITRRYLQRNEYEHLLEEYDEEDINQAFQRMRFVFTEEVLFQLFCIFTLSFPSFHIQYTLTLDTMAYRLYECWLRDLNAYLHPAYPLLIKTLNEKRKELLPLFSSTVEDVFLPTLHPKPYWLVEELFHFTYEAFTIPTEQERLLLLYGEHA